VNLDTERNTCERLARECLQLQEKNVIDTRRIEALEQQILKYQQTETVLAQVIEFSSKV
jgi:hypothetical protein